MLEPATLARRSAFDGLLQAVGAPDAAGIVVRECTDLQIATVIARRSFSMLADRVPTGRIAFIGTGPRTWLAVRKGGGSLAVDLQRDLGETAAVTDQSDGYAVLRLSGPKVRATFEKGLSVDLHPRAFGVGDAAVTTCSHLGVILWQLDAAPTYEIALFRSLAADFWHWLSDSAAEFGLRVETDRG
jgi:methylglutamate dehydrogenase subunit D